MSVPELTRRQLLVGATVAVAVPSSLMEFATSQPLAPFMGDRVLAAYPGRAIAPEMTSRWHVANREELNDAVHDPDRDLYWLNLHEIPHPRFENTYHLQGGLTSSFLAVCLIQFRDGNVHLRKNKMTDGYRPEDGPATLEFARNVLGAPLHYEKVSNIRSGIFMNWST